MAAISIESSIVDFTGQHPADLRPSYPSYKSFDEFIDVERLRSLDGYLTRGIQRHMDDQRDDLFLNQHCLDADAPYVPGVREIWLTRTAPGTPYDYLDINRHDLWHRTEHANEFGLLVSFIDTLPFQHMGRILMIYDVGGHNVPAHKDHERTDICHEFIWLRTNLRKRFYVLNEKTGERLFVDSYSAWFDTVNQYHGSDAADGLSFSIRVDGTFTDEFRRHIPQPGQNLASTPALWKELVNGSGN